MASITFNDGTARTLTTTAPAPANRFSGWSARPVLQGPVEFGLGTGTRYVEEFRTDWKVTFSITLLRPDDQDVAQWLLLHLQRGNTCTLNTADTGSRVYTAFMGDGDEVTISGPDEQDPRLQYTVQATLTISAPATPPLCVY